MKFEEQVKVRAFELKMYFQKGVKAVSKYGKKGWQKVKNIRK
ncbi:hypothetical protein vseg_015178 [Gypsophila vaccaria]